MPTQQLPGLTSQQHMPGTMGAMPPVLKGGKRGKRRSGRRGMRGGTSGWQSVFNSVGGGDTQWSNVFGPSSAQQNGNLITHADGSPQMSAASNAAAAGKGPFSMTGGRRRKHKHSKRCSHKRNRRGGSWGGMLGQALVPFGLLATQRATAKRSRHTGTKKHHRRR